MLYGTIIFGVLAYSMLCSIYVEYMDSHHNVEDDIIIKFHKKYLYMRPTVLWLFFTSFWIVFIGTGLWIMLFVSIIGSFYAMFLPFFIVKLIIENYEKWKKLRRKYPFLKK